MKKKHDGDCSIYALGCKFCDCGYFRQLLRTGKAYDGMTDEDELWVELHYHENAILEHQHDD
jgi:hypothetical protein